MSIFQSGVHGKKADVRFVSGNAGFGSARRAATGARPVAMPRRTELSRGATSEIAVGVARLFFPVLLLVTACAAAVIYGNQPARQFGFADIGGTPFDTGLVTLPLTFLIVQLTNRRYGAGYAVVQVLGATAAALAILMYGSSELVAMRGSGLPPTRVIAAFGSGLFAAQMISIFTFDRLRGPQWWQAPLSASLLGGAALSFIAYPAAYFGTGLDWFSPMTTYLGIAAGASVLLLVPYWLLRPVIAPMGGFGGY